MLHNTVEAVEGVIADSIDGGIGYRNHTVPSNLPYGGEWSEEILWIEPVTECADTNLTFEIHVGDYAGNITSLDLVDNGGFVDHPQHIDLDTRPSQDLDLRERALMGALLSNRLLMLHFKVKDPNDTRPWNSIMGQRFPLNVTNTLLLVPLYTMQLTQLTPNFYHLEPFGSDSYYGGNSTTIPTGNTSDDWQMVQDFCQGGSDIRQANTSNIALICGYLYGAPTPTYPDDRLIFRPYSTWKQSLYVCSSSIRAGVKVVSFSSNGTQSLESLHITDVRDKAYADLASAPLWAVERTYKDLFEASALWGPVAEKYSASPDLTTYRAPKFFLPAISSQRTITGSGHSLAATDVFIAALMGVYESYYPGGPLADYSGQASAALRSKWQTLSQAAATASKIVNLIYTDLLATATVGTKSAQRPENSAASSGAAVQRAGPPRPPKVTMYNRRLQYNYLYGIPAAIILFITIATAIVLLLCLVFRFKYKAFVQLLNQTSTGRIITNLIYPEVSQPDVKTKTWAKMAGGTKLKYPFHTALEEDQPATPVSMSEVNPEGVSTDEVTQLQESQASTQNGGSQVVESGVYSEQEHDVSHGDDVSQRRPLIASPSPSPMEDEAAKREGMQVQVWQL